MSQKNVNICCTQYKDEECIHPAVPKSFVTKMARCVEVHPIRHNDPRIGIVDKCKIRVPFERPPIPPAPPKPL